MWLGAVDVPLWAILVTPVAFFIYRYSTRNHGIWRARGITGPWPLPFIGTALPIFMRGIMQFDLESIRRYGNVVGTFEGINPVLLVADTEMLKLIMVKDFHIFQNRRSTISNALVTRRFLPRLKDAHWKHVRAILTPAFSSGKLKKMVPAINRCALTISDHVAEIVAQGQNVNIKEFTGPFSMDVIASIGFGIHIDSYRDSDLPFVKHIKQILELNIVSWRIVLLLLFPFHFVSKLMERAKLGMFPQEALEFFTDIVRRTITQRQNDDINQTDILQMLMTSRVDDVGDDNDPDSVDGPDGRWTKKGLTEEDILAQALVFFMAGYETTASSLMFLFHCLATNTTCQDKLMEEIENQFDDRDPVTYERMNEMPYLDMCIKETLRMYPITHRVTRVCSQDCLVGSVPIPRGVMIAIPVYALHHDPKVWPEPDKFRPERFSPEEKATRNPFFYQPFGSGPRICIGTRLALLELKVAAIRMMRRFRFHVCDETQESISFKNHLLLAPKKPIELKLTLREDR